MSYRKQLWPLSPSPASSLAPQPPPPAGPSPERLLLLVRMSCSRSCSLSARFRSRCSCRLRSLSCREQEGGLRPSGPRVGGPGLDTSPSYHSTALLLQDSLPIHCVLHLLWDRESVAGGCQNSRVQRSPSLPCYDALRPRPYLDQWRDK